MGVDAATTVVTSAEKIKREVEYFIALRIILNRDELFIISPP